MEREIVEENREGSSKPVGQILLSLAVTILMVQIEIIKLIDGSWRFFTLDGILRVCEIDDADCVKQMGRRTEKFLP
jgi:hypothetical protein